MLASTLPVQWLLPALGWRGLFWAVAALLAAGDGRRGAPGLADPRPTRCLGAGGGRGRLTGRRRQLPQRSLRHPLFVRSRAAGLLRLWRPDRGAVAVGRALAHARGRLERRPRRRGGLFVDQPVHAVRLPGLGRRDAAPGRAAASVPAPHDLGAAAAAAVAVRQRRAAARASRRRASGRCGACRAPSSRSASRPSAQAFPAALAGRALSAFNLVIFGGVFCIQWGIGLLIDGLRALGLARGRRVPARVRRLRPVLRGGLRLVSAAAAPRQVPIIAA